jgi:hypothetical protein
MLGSGPAGRQGWNWDDGHLSRILIAQDLKRPYPPRLCTHVLHRSKCKRAAHIPCIVQRRRGLFGLAPGGVYPATLITQGTGELLPHLFTLTLWNKSIANFAARRLQFNPSPEIN